MQRVTPAGTGQEQEFVVEVWLDRARTIRGAARTFGWVMVVVIALCGAVISVLAVALMLLDAWAGAACAAAAGVLAAGSAVTSARRLYRTRASWQPETVLSAGVIWISAAGLRLRVEGAPALLFLPWEAVAAARVRSLLGVRQLCFQLRPDVPGVEGVQQSAVQRVLQQGNCELGYGVAVLSAPPGHIDQALRHFSGGRLRLWTKAPSRQ